MTTQSCKCHVHFPKIDNDNKIKLRLNFFDRKDEENAKW